MIPKIGSHWARKAPHDPDQGPYNIYTVVFITNTAHEHPDHPPQVVYKGTNGNIWSLPVAEWPGNLVALGKTIKATLRYEQDEEYMLHVPAAATEEDCERILESVRLSQEASRSFGFEIVGTNFEEIEDEHTN